MSVFQYLQSLRLYPYSGQEAPGFLAGRGLVVAAGRATLVDGAASIEDLFNVGPASIIVVSSMDAAVTGNLRVVNIINGVGFDIESTNLGDNGEVGWLMI